MGAKTRKKIITKILRERNEQPSLNSYSDETLEAIAIAAALNVDLVKKQRSVFEGSFFWFRLKESKNNLPPSALKKRLQAIENKANQLAELIEDGQTFSLIWPEDKVINFIHSLHDAADAAKIAQVNKERPVHLNPENEWLMNMHKLYKNLSGRAAKSIPTDPDTNQPTGRLLRFIEAAMPPTGLCLTPQAIQSRLKKLLKEKKLRALTN